MISLHMLVFVVSASLVSSENKIPVDFKIGFATSSYQIEGAWNESGKGENIWDRLTHTTNLVHNGDTGDIACDSYHKYGEDVQILRDVGANFYRFSLSWSRILPTGQINLINEEGVAYYNNLINALLANNIEPMVTIYHWDLPQPLQDIGGWPNPLMENYFVDYATLCFKLFGDRIKLWTTFNEPMQICHRGYGSGQMAPAIKSPGIGEYLCAHTLIKSHARAFRIYDSKFRCKQKGKISLVADFSWFEPLTNSTGDIAAANKGNHFYYGWFINPLVHGDYPEIMKNSIAEKSKKEGYSKSRLPKFTKMESDYIRGTYDFLGVNIYVVLQATSEIQNGTGFFSDINIRFRQDPSWESTMLEYFVVEPWSARKILNFIKDNYNNPEIYVTENGIADDGSSLEDDKRISYIKGYLGNILDAKLKDGVNVKGWTYWSLLDNFEWYSGYKPKFGICSVDFNSSNRTRTLKKSAEYIRKITTTRCLVDNCT